MISSFLKKIKNTLKKNRKSGREINLSKINDPRIKNYLDHKIIMELPVELGRVKYFFRLSSSNEPFIEALLNSKDNQNKLNKAQLKIELRNYYQNYQPTTAQWLGLNNLVGNDFNEIKAWEMPLPWNSDDLINRSKKVRRWEKKDNLEVNYNLKIDHGFSYFGPVSEEKLTIETERLYGLYHSINRNGYDYSKIDRHIGANILIKGDQWRWYVAQGQHRSCVLSSLGYNKITVEIKNLIYRNEADIWPNVLNGLYTIKESVQIFDNIYNGR